MDKDLKILDLKGSFYAIILAIIIVVLTLPVCVPYLFLLVTRMGLELLTKGVKWLEELVGKVEKPLARRVSKLPGVRFIYDKFKNLHKEFRKQRIWRRHSDSYKQMESEDEEVE